MAVSESVLEQLQAARVLEKEQALFYRALASVAEVRDLADDIDALNGLLADEQHHLSRLTVRLLELGHIPIAVTVEPPACDFDSWRDVAREREFDEIKRYERILNEPLDEVTRALLRDIADVERQHMLNLRGKYTEA